MILHLYNTFIGRLLPIRLANLKKWKAAIMDFRAALSLDPSNTSARQYLDTTIVEEERHRLNVRVVLLAIRKMLKV